MVKNRKYGSMFLHKLYDKDQSTSQQTTQPYGHPATFAYVQKTPWETAKPTYWSSVVYVCCKVNSELQTLMEAGTALLQHSTTTFYLTKYEN